MNRIDETIIFNSLSKDSIYEILDKLVIDLNNRLKDKRVTIKLDSDAREYIVENGYDPLYGARPLKRFLSSNVETLLAK